MSTVGPLSGVQIAHVAREHYVNGKSRVEIAEETGLSRFKIGRMLDEAVERGIIRFEIVSAPGIDLDRSTRLRQRFGLEQAVAVEIPVDTDDSAQRGLATASAELLEELVGPADVLGLTSGRTLNAMARQLHRLPCRAVVQLAGVAGPIRDSGLEVIRRLAGFPHVETWPIYSSLVMSDAQTARGVLHQPSIDTAVRMFDQVTVAICAVGSWSPPNSLMLANPALTTEDRLRLLRRGVVAEVAATLVTDRGEVVHDIDDRFVAVTERQFRAIGSRVAIAGGPSKTRAIRAVLTADLMTGLVTDTFTADRLLAS